MLLDVIGTVFAFVTVILLLSLVVTGSTQLVTASLRLRVRNLRRALSILINDQLGGGLTKKQVRMHVDNTITAANFGTLTAPKDMIAGLGLIRLSRIPAETLVRCLKIAGIPVKDATAEEQVQF